MAFPLKKSSGNILKSSIQRTLTTLIGAMPLSEGGNYHDEPPDLSLGFENPRTLG
jgi:hypothetical protein